MSAERAYNAMLKSGVAPEQARMVLPANMYTEWYWTGTLYAFARICGLRCKPDTQLETRELANQISDQMKTVAPNSWEALTTW